MGAPKRPRWSSLQYWPRKRAEKLIPSVNWKPIKGDGKTEGLLGYILYKAAMATAVVKDETPASMTKGKKMAVPVTILEAPNMKVFSVRFYKHGKVEKEVVVSNDKELKRQLKVPKEIKNFDSEAPKSFDDIRVIVYSLASQTDFKKTPDLIELAVSAKDKLSYVKSIIGKEITIKDFKYELVDVRGSTKGKGLVSAIKRHGLSLKAHKSEKGVRRPGSLGPWHPARVTFRTPMAGQLGMFSRVHYNQKVLTHNTIAEKDINKGTGFKHYGKIVSSYIIIEGSVQGPVKRQILITPSFRPTKYQAKKKYEFQEVLV
jgi:large subunit ribosomal protein L3